MTVSAFGQKERDAMVNLEELVDPEGIVEMDVHVGVDIHPLQQDDTILWGKTGLRELSVGQIYPSLSLSDCGSLIVKARRERVTRNQLGDLRQDLDGRLAAVIKRRAYFLQLYNNSPHYRPNEFHSVSGLQAASQCVHPQVSNRVKHCLFVCLFVCSAAV